MGEAEKIGVNGEIDPRLQSSLEHLIADGALRERVERRWQKIRSKTEKRILGSAHGVNHMVSVAELTGQVVNSERFQALNQSPALKALLAIAVIHHDFGGVPREGEPQAKSYQNHERKSADLATQWLDQNREAVEAALSNSGINFETARSMVRSMILATNVSIDLYSGKPPLTKDLFSRLNDSERNLLDPADNDPEPIREFKELVRVVANEVGEDSVLFQDFCQSLEAISAADLGAYLKEPLLWLSELTAMWAEFQQGYEEEGEIKFRRPPAPESGYAGWMISDFTSRVLAVYGPCLPQATRENGEAITALQKKLAGIPPSQKIDNWLEAQTRAAENLPSPDYIVRFEAALTPPILVELAEKFGIDLATEVKGRTLKDLILDLGDQILRSTSRSEGWGPMASDIFESFYSLMTNQEQRRDLLERAFDLISERLSPSGKTENWFQIAAGRYQKDDPEVLSLLHQIAEEKNWRIILIYRADQDNLDRLEDFLKLTDEQVGLALGGRLSEKDAADFFDLLEQRNYSGNLVIHWRRGASLSLMAEGVLAHLDRIKEAGEKSRTVLHLDENYRIFTFLKREPHLLKRIKEAVEENRLVLAVSPLGELDRERDDFRELASWLQDEGIKLTSVTNNAIGVGGCGRLVQEAAIASVLGF